MNLLSKKVFDDYLSKSNALESDLELHQRKSDSNIVIIDEIQKLPELLDEVHNQIEKNKKLRFILTGSSARKLK
ncbi:MAG TPA: AAA family ATPase [Pseudobdellovibrionaceae bacterium]